MGKRPPLKRYVVLVESGLESEFVNDPNTDYPLMTRSIAEKVAREHRRINELNENLRNITIFKLVKVS